MKLYLQLFYRVVASEIQKLRSTFVFWLTIIYPLGTVFLVSLIWFGNRNAKVVSTDQFISNLGNSSSFFLTFFIVLLISLACNIEFKSAMLKHLLTLPVPRPIIYLGKFAGIMLFIGLAMVLTLAFAYLSLLICGLINPKLGMGINFNHAALVLNLLRSYIAAAAIYSIQYWLSMKLKNLTLPVAIGSTLIVMPIAILIILGITGLISRNADFLRVITYNPYSYPYSPGFNFVKSTEIVIFTSNTIVFILLSIVSLAFGTWEFSRRNIS